MTLRRCYSCSRSPSPTDSRRSTLHAPRTTLDRPASPRLVRPLSRASRPRWPTLPTTSPRHGSPPPSTPLRATHTHASTSEHQRQAPSPSVSFLPTRLGLLVTHPAPPRVIPSAILAPLSPSEKKWRGVGRAGESSARERRHWLAAATDRRKLLRRAMTKTGREARGHVMQGGRESWAAGGGGAGSTRDGRAARKERSAGERERRTLSKRAQ